MEQSVPNINHIEWVSFVINQHKNIGW
jgi:hypothetical protein